MALVEDYIATRVSYLMDFTGPSMNAAVLSVRAA